eukprot:TRINITY_DN11784_c0_g5_i3.p1 TRINITY_DN11784_c0_g5~~TRINITY_DN11784_c0_g5_i3.p1  ORF type:complete len:160 (-),score=37.75 TRINITY_DN11784_c0_g5_i3:92-571(-)
MKGSRSVQGGFVGSPICMAPEVARRNASYGPQCDMWSVGCIAHELLSGEPPFVATDAEELFSTIRSGCGPAFREEVWSNVSSAGQDFVRALLQLDPEDRPSAKEALNHDWFTNAPDDYNVTAHSAILHRRTTKRNGALRDSEDLEVETRTSSCALRRWR